MSEMLLLSRLALARLLGGQFLSLVASGTSQFALGIWAFQQTNQAASATLLTTAYLTPLLMLSPLAGALADRVSKKQLMFIGDVVSAATAAVALLLHHTGVLDVWHLYVLAVINGSAQTFHWPAYAAATSELVRAKHYGRVHGFTSLAENGAKVFAPAVGGIMLAVLGLPAILALNVIGSAGAAGLLLSVPMPHVRKPQAAEWSFRALWRESVHGFSYIAERPALLNLQLVFFSANLFLSMASSLVIPYVLAVSHGNTMLLGSVQAAGAVGGIAGALVMGVWGGPKRGLVQAILLFWVCVGMFAVGPLGLGRSPALIGAMIFSYTFFGPLIGGCSQALWQRKVPPAVQGRVFATRRLIAWAAGPLGTAIAGPLADRVFEPAVQTAAGGAKAALGGLVIAGPGAGIGLLIATGGACIALVALAGLGNKRLQQIDEALPDTPQPRADIPLGGSKASAGS